MTRNYTQTLVFTAACILALIILLQPQVKADETMTSLGIQGSSFKVNGKPTFLLGISYYGGLGASEDWPTTR